MPATVVNFTFPVPEVVNGENSGYKYDGCLSVVCYLKGSVLRNEGKFCASFIDYYLRCSRFARVLVHEQNIVEKTTCMLMSVYDNKF